MTTRLIVCSLESWDDIWRRNQHLVHHLLQSNPELQVCFVEPAWDPLHELAQRRRPRRGRGLHVVPGYDGRLHTFQPTKWLPRLAGPLADALLRSAVRTALRRLGWRDALLWINDPRWWTLAASTGWPALYDVTDDWVEADRSQRVNQMLRDNEGRLLQIAREVVVCSPALERSKGAIRAVTLVRNAADTTSYRTPHERPSDLPDVPVALYVGTLHEDRLDVDLVLQTAADAAAIGGAVVLVGPQMLRPHNSARLAGATGLRVLGARTKELVPAYLQHAHVLLVPHVVDRFTDSLDPIKLYEYSASGRPIVSTPVAGFREERGMPGLTIVAADAFSDAATSALRNWTEVVHGGGAANWSDRAREMAAIIGRLDHRDARDDP